VDIFSFIDFIQGYGFMMSVLPSRVKQLRVDKGWTQERLALVAGLSYRTIQRIEKDGKCSLDSKMALATAFGLAHDDLLNEGNSLFNAMFDLTTVLDGQGIFKSVYTTTPELLYRPADEVIGKNYVDVLPPHVSQAVTKALTKLKKGAKMAEFDYQLTLPTGMEYFNVKMVRSDSDSFFSVITEISQQKATEKKQLKNAELLSLVADTLKTGAWEMDLITMDIVWTKQVYDIYELEKIPTINEGINYYAQEARPLIQHAFTNLVDLGIPYDLQLPFITAKGKKLQVRVVGLPLFANAQVISVSGIIQDVTHPNIN
jgi:DNA-binding XRE family transcriptional regulator